MAYITADEVKVIRNNLKKEFPEFKFSVTRDNSTAIAVCIMSGPVEFVPGKPNAQLNHFYPDNYQHADILKKMIAIVNAKNYDNSDTMTDYFDVGYFVHIEQGKWDKPYVLVQK